MNTVPSRFYPSVLPAFNSLHNSSASACELQRLNVVHVFVLERFQIHQSPLRSCATR